MENVESYKENILLQLNEKSTNNFIEQNITFSQNSKGLQYLFYIHFQLLYHIII